MDVKFLNYFLKIFWSLLRNYDIQPSNSYLIRFLNHTFEYKYHRAL